MAEKIFDIKRRSYQYALETVKFIEQLPSDLVSNTIGKQLLRSATSIGANITEAKAASSRKDFINFYSYALKSANESKFWLNLLKDSNKVAPLTADKMIAEAGELSNIIAASIMKLKGKKDF